MTENRDVLSRPASAPDLTVRYGSHPDQVADLWLPPRPAGSGPAPAVLLWHGGFWRAEFDRAHVGPMAGDLAGRGFAVAVMEYRRIGGGGGWPTTFTDVAGAADTVPALIEEALPGRVDQSRVVYAGHSAGGHLAVWAALRDRIPAGSPGHTTTMPRIAGVLALAPVLDLADAHRLAQGDSAVEALLGGGPREVPERFAGTDPTTLGTPAAPVTLVHGDRDGRVPVEMSRRYRVATGSRLVEVPSADHFALIDPESAAWPAVLGALHLLAGHGHTRQTGAPTRRTGDGPR